MRLLTRLVPIALVMSLMLMGAASASAAELKVGVVDVEYVIIKSKSGKAAKKKLKKIFEKRQKELDKKQEDLLELKKKIENPSDLDSPDRRRKLVQEYQQGLLQLQEAFVKHQQELAKKEMELMKPILKKLESVLTEYAQGNDYDMLLTRSQNGVIFAKPAFDVTEDVLKKFDGA